MHMLSLFLEKHLDCNFTGKQKSSRLNASFFASHLFLHSLLLSVKPSNPQIFLLNSLSRTKQNSNHPGIFFFIPLQVWPLLPIPSIARLLNKLSVFTVYTSSFSSLFNLPHCGFCLNHTIETHECH